MDLKSKIRVIEDYPIEGISFKDITTLLKDSEALKDSVNKLNDLCKKYDFDYILAPEARGFIYGTVIAYLNNKGFIPIRKPGKLPYKTIKKEYELEYGTNSIEMHSDALKKGDKVLIIDDLLATAGTTRAIIDMVEECEAKVVGCVFLIELDFLKGRDIIKGYEVESLISY